MSIKTSEDLASVDSVIEPVGRAPPSEVLDPINEFDINPIQHPITVYTRDDDVPNGSVVCCQECKDPQYFKEKRNSPKPFDKPCPKASTKACTRACPRPKRKNKPVCKPKITCKRKLKPCGRPNKACPKRKPKPCPKRCS